MINIQIDETAEYYQVVKRSRNQHDHEDRNQIDHDMELKHWQHAADHVKIREGKEDNEYNIIKIFTDGSKGELGVGAGVAIFKEGNLEEALKYRLNGKCSNNQAEQLAILKAIQHVQTLESQQQKFSIFTDSRITLDSLRNQTNHTHLIEEIRREVKEAERKNWKIEFNWIKAHAGHEGNELADQLAKEAARSENIQESYSKTPKSAVKAHLNAIDLARNRTRNLGHRRPALYQLANQVDFSPINKATIGLTREYGFGDVWSKDLTKLQETNIMFRQTHRFHFFFDSTTVTVR
ncbi:hypothetical protein ANN_11165 [Periplaneta americana]|uniref:ribonuclease H n=1 Tax=Periplaneta americana TaxID=6978 RepID=A0ABQ8T485_PERAM|nr:hypothetical protein ANN_11165 [Periplaneta americana]